MFCVFTRDFTSHHTTIFIANVATEQAVHSHYVSNHGDKGVPCAFYTAYCDCKVVWQGLVKINLSGRRCEFHLCSEKAWWRHHMETFYALLILCVGNSLAPANSLHKGQWRGALMFSLICAWINGWVNDHEAGDFGCHRAHYYVTVMLYVKRNL